MRPVVHALTFGSLFSPEIDDFAAAPGALLIVAVAVVDDVAGFVGPRKLSATQRVFFLGGFLGGIVLADLFVEVVAAVVDLSACLL